MRPNCFTLRNGGIDLNINYDWVLEESTCWVNLDLDKNVLNLNMNPDQAQENMCINLLMQMGVIIN